MQVFQVTSEQGYNITQDFYWCLLSLSIYIFSLILQSMHRAIEKSFLLPFLEISPDRVQKEKRKEKRRSVIPKICSL